MDKITAWFNNIGESLPEAWIIELLLIPPAVWVITRVVRAILRAWTNERSDTMSAATRKAFLESVRTPLAILFWLFGVATALNIIDRRFEISSVDKILTYMPLVYIALLGWFLLRFKNAYFYWVPLQQRGLNLSTQDFISKIITAVVIVMLVLMALPKFGVSIDGILAVGGMGGLIIGFAAKDMLANFFGAFSIYLDKPFALGDWIYLPEKDVEGVVEVVGWRQIVIRTFNKQQVFVPNAMIGTMVLINPGRMTHRRIYETIGVRYDDVDMLPAILKDVTAYLDSHEEIDQSQGTLARLASYGAYSVDFLVSAFTSKTGWDDYMRIKEDVLFRISHIITSHGAEIAFPTQVTQIQSIDPNLLSLKKAS